VYEKAASSELVVRSPDVITGASLASFIEIVNVFEVLSPPLSVD
jgi:hypothetical protein